MRRGSHALGACRLGEEGGQILALTVLVMVVLLGAAALAIDIGSLDSAKERLQGVAEAAAIAAARDLPGSVVSAETDAGNLVTTNLAGSAFTNVTVSYVTPFKGSSSEIEVTVSARAPDFFANVFGASSTAVSAAAAAKNTPTAGTAEALFASNTTCGLITDHDGVYVHGNMPDISGVIHSNGRLNVTSNMGTFGSGSYGGPSGCAYTDTGNKTKWTTAPTVDGNNEPFPETWTVGQITCDHTSAAAHLQLPNAQFPNPLSGVYCDPTGLIEVNGNMASGSVTSVANQVTLDGNMMTLTPYDGNLLVYQTGSSQFTDSANMGSLTGTIYVPTGNVLLSGNHAFVGFVEGLNIEVSSNMFKMTGNGPSIGASNSVVPTE